VIGDTPLDIEAGAEHGTRTAGVATGPFGEEILRQAGADLVLSSMADYSMTVPALLALVAD
jgi:phosphoglycolate phosphatase-like HAD superfamily hydrolase